MSQEKAAELYKKSSDILEACGDIAKMSEKQFYNIEQMRVGKAQGSPITELKNFLDLEEPIKNIIEKCRSLSQLSTEKILSLGPTDVEQLHTISLDLRKSLNQLSAFHHDLKSYEDGAEINKRNRDTLVRQFTKNMSSFIIKTSPLATELLETTLLKKILLTVDKNVTSEIKSKLTEALLENKSNKATEDSLKPFSNKFYETEEEDHRKAARNWAILGAFLSILVIVLGGALYYIEHTNFFENKQIEFVQSTRAGIPENKETEKASASFVKLEEYQITKLIRDMTLKFLVFGFTISLAYMCFKNYSINKHNQLHYLHKRLSLESYSLVMAAKTFENEDRLQFSEKLIDAILNKQDFGYINTSKEEIEKLTELMAVLKRTT